MTDDTHPDQAKAQHFILEATASEALSDASDWEQECFINDEPLELGLETMLEAIQNKRATIAL